MIKHYTSTINRSRSWNMLDDNGHVDISSLATILDYRYPDVHTRGVAVAQNHNEKLYL
jgi:hypothetical protein